jgi:hypothetical protein
MSNNRADYRTISKPCPAKLSIADNASRKNGSARVLNCVDDMVMVG